MKRPLHAWNGTVLYQYTKKICLTIQITAQESEGSTFVGKVALRRAPPYNMNSVHTLLTPSISLAIVRR